MAELIDKMQNIMCESCTSCEANWCDGEDKAECQWMQKIAEVGTTTEEEIRAKAIDEFTEKAMRKLTELELKNTCYTVTDCKIILRDVAEQLKGEGGMVKPIYTEGNADNINKAVEGLNQFTHNYCMNCKETEEKNQPIFRCKECNFQDALGICLVKEFVIDKTGDMPLDFGSMGR